MGFFSLLAVRFIKEEQLNTLKTILIIVLVVLLSIAAFLAVNNDFFFKKADPLTLIPSNAVLVFETQEPVMAWNEIVTQPIWERLSSIPALNKMEGHLMTLDSLAGKSGNLDKALKGQQFVLSLHPIGRDEFDFLFAIGFEEDGLSDFLSQIKSGVADPSGIKTRNYSGVTLHEFPVNSGSGVFTYGIYENILLASHTSFLVEDAIRLVKSTELKNFKETYLALFQPQETVQGMGVLRIGSSGLSKLFASATTDRTDDFSRQLKDLQMAANFRFVFEEDKFNLFGELSPVSGAPISIYSTADKNIEAFNAFISNRTAIFRYHHLGQSGDLHNRLPEISQFRNTILAEIESQLLSRGFFDNLSGEVGLMVFEGFNKEELEKVLLIPVKDVKTSLKMLEDFSVQLNQGDRELLIKDRHRGNEFFPLGLEEFPMHLFEGRFEGFGETVVSSLGEYIIFANSIRTLKNYLDDYGNDSMWGKSVYQKEYVENVPKTAVFSQLIDVNKFYNLMLPALTPNWRSVFQRYAQEIQAFDMISLSISSENEKANVQVSFDYHLEPIRKTADILLTRSREVTFNQTLVYGPKVLENFNDKSKEYLVQDENMTLHLINSGGDRVFSRDLSGVILSQVFQVDYYKNDKLQVVFATKEGIYGFDRIGEPLPDFPIVLPDGKSIAHFNVVDYDKSRDYRFFVSDESGDLYIFDQGGQLLEGWNPRRSTGSLAAPPAHHRIPGMGDFMVSLHENGNLEIMNRRGESRIGSSVRLGESVSTEYGLTDRGGSVAQLVSINDAGELVKVNFNGELTYRNQLFRPDRETKFKIVPNQNGDNFLIVIHQFNKINILSQDEESLFNWEILSEDLYFQWFSFGYQKDIFVVIDRVQEFVYLFNLKGELLNSKPLNGKTPISVSYSGSRNEFLIHTIFEKSLMEFKLPM